MLLLAYLNIFLARKQKCQRNALAWGFFVHFCLFVLSFLCWVFWVCFFYFGWLVVVVVGVFCSFHYFPFLFFPFHCSTVILGLKDIVEEESGCVMLSVFYDWGNKLPVWLGRQNHYKFSIKMQSMFLEQVAFKVCFVVAEL